LKWSGCAVGERQDDTNCVEEAQCSAKEAASPASKIRSTWGRDTVWMNRELAMNPSAVHALCQRFMGSSLHPDHRH
jgi:hypothetical protein